VTSRLLEALAARPLLLDAAMGTRLIARGLDLRTDDTPFWNLTHPEVVREIHGLDVDAGSDAILTNTFGANSAWLDRYGRAGEVAEINRRAVVLARDAAGTDRFVLGSIGPTAAGSAGAYREQAEALAEAGVDGLLLETHTLDRALVGLSDIVHAVDLPTLVSLTSWGTDPGRDALHLIEAGADVLGTNCTVTPQARFVFGPIRDVSPIPLLIKPTGQLPGRSPLPVRTFASFVPIWLRWGVRLMGGCCGTTEAHVAAMRSALDEATAGRV
jgi:5-methyltetrahydrofolate--homocysteine methyltransferase